MPRSPGRGGRRPRRPPMIRTLRPATCLAVSYSERLMSYISKEFACPLSVRSMLVPCPFVTTESRYVGPAQPLSESFSVRRTHRGPMLSLPGSRALRAARRATKAGPGASRSARAQGLPRPAPARGQQLQRPTRARCDARAREHGQGRHPALASEPRGATGCLESSGATSTEPVDRKSVV